MYHRPVLRRQVMCLQVMRRPLYRPVRRPVRLPVQQTAALALGKALLLCTLAAARSGRAAETVTIPVPHTTESIQADWYGRKSGSREPGQRAVVLVHGGQFHKQSWKPLAEVLARANLVVLAISLRGDHLNPDGSPGSFGTDADNTADVLASVAYLHRSGFLDVAAVGASLGGDAVGQAAAETSPGKITRLIILGAAGGPAPEKLTGRKLFLVAREDRSGSGLRLPGIRRSFARVPEPKRLLVLDGSAHAQHLFATEQGPRVLHEIVAFLTAP